MARQERVASSDVPPRDATVREARIADRRGEQNEQIRSNDSRSREDTRGETTKDYIVRRDPDIRGATKGRREENEKSRDGKRD